ncbi:alginate O-acetyltransferase AlgX-related protein [Echinimonas agarilytica]|uniref:AlgX/AlgJ SGNH hydrolase-like domain-containing protein n=1 Tax=Echinimonas agarilytica TaxID=1215918 RepID=A0AA42B8N1_9GAMM|nr:alginate biosynthesis protein AlgX [Echinimonas agarilytica]MCM2681220.1 hypothetical protein [Echinimonas agarilytica]
MRRTAKLIYLLLCTSIASASAFAEEDVVASPEYKVEHFEQLCVAAENEENYNTELLKSLRYLVQGDNGWVYRTSSDFIEDFDTDGNYDDLKRFRDYLAIHGTSLMMLYVPTRGLMNPKDVPEGLYDYPKAIASYEAKLHMFREMGILVPDLEGMIKEYQSTPFFFLRDIHWEPEGAKKSAEYVARAIKESELIDTDLDFDVNIVEEGSYTVTGGLADGIKQLCDEQYVLEYVKGYGFEEVVSSSEDSLFSDDVAEPEVVLLGTSFSRLPRMNFHGFLQKELGAPVTNYAISGGGDDGAWLKYFKSGEFLENPPKLIVWEVSAYYDLNDKGMFAQLIPSAEMGCSEESALLTQSLPLQELSDDVNSVFFGDQFKDLNLNDIVLDVSFSEPDVNRMEFKLWYTDGQVKSARISKPSRAETGGEFTFKLFSHLLKPKGGLMAMQLVSVEGETVSEYIDSKNELNPELNVRVCTI